MSQPETEAAVPDPTGVQRKIAQKVAEGGLPTLVLLGAAYTLSGQLDRVTEAVAVLQEDVKALEIRAAGDRWTATQQREFDDRISTRLRQIEDRLERVEVDWRRRE